MLRAILLAVAAAITWSASSRRRHARWGLLLGIAAPLPASAYQCTISPAKDAVVIKTDNASAQSVTCKVDCRFATPAGMVSFSCSQQIPPQTKGWYVCLRPIEGAAAQFAGGGEICK
jgi:hypothetical protein